MVPVEGTSKSLTSKIILENISNILAIIVPADGSALVDAGILFERVMASC